MQYYYIFYNFVNNIASFILIHVNFTCCSSGCCFNGGQFGFLCIRAKIATFGKSACKHFRVIVFKTILCNIFYCNYYYRVPYALESRYYYSMVNLTYYFWWIYTIVIYGLPSYFIPSKQWDSQIYNRIIKCDTYRNFC